MIELSPPIQYRPISQIANPIAHIPSPFSGKVLPLSTYTNAAIASGMLGIGVCVQMRVPLLLSPCNGKLIQIRKNNCEYILHANNGLKMLLSLEIGNEFAKPEYLKANSFGKTTIKLGEPLCFFDIPLSEAKTMAAIVLLNAQKLGACYYPLKQVSAAKEPIITIARACAL
ncbi:PTS sugar transporter [Pseudoalteromonas sp. A22]|uniref:PTS glucose transporter subunit IIA n=1 Tax=Pseudoalteromonas TaxID=53246 RepID=UPI001BAABCB2|nr:MULTISPECIES: PTS glucose transporter subunit IIA [Pseudoalteromonas]QUI63855.1 PTS sugar transporter [Pseudoalteromonas sp. A22]USE69552.1 PTS sugar transporter [Pseudoalteromonas flavipulchra]